MRTLDRAWLPALRALRTRRSVILCYHGVDESTAAEDPKFLRASPLQFRRQLDLLVAAGFELVTVAEMASLATAGAPPPGRIALSFDDGMEDNHRVLLPILLEYGAPATVYVATGMIGASNPFVTGTRTRMMSAGQLRELASAGIELGAHSVSHPDLAQLDRAACDREVGESKATLAQLTGARVETFAYPYCSYHRAAIDAVEAAGFRAAVTCHGRGGWARFEMKRSMITGKDGLPSFVLKLWEAYQPLFGSRLGTALRSATRGLRRQARSRRERSRGGDG